MDHLVRFSGVIISKAYIGLDFTRNREEISSFIPRYVMSENVSKGIILKEIIRKKQHCEISFFVKVILPCFL